ncbi:MAG: GvpL/GvpF family gas vesicle protein, partial [Bacteroidota bacterium]
MQELYVYGLIQEKPSQPLPQKGLANHPIEYVAADNYFALVSPWPSSSPPEPVMPSRKNLLSHQKVLSEVLAQTSILPFKFGTLMQKETLVNFCREASPRLEENFLRIAHKIEVSLKGAWHSIQKIYDEILEENPAIHQQKELLAQQATPPDQHQLIDIGKQVEMALLHKKDSLSEYIHRFLKNQIVDIRFK